MKTQNLNPRRRTWKWVAPLAVLASVLAVQGANLTWNVRVLDGDRAAITTAPPAPGFRWLIEEDNTVQKPPGTAVNDSISLVIHKSHAPVTLTGVSGSSTFSVSVPDDANPEQRYYLSVMADGYSLGGAALVEGTTEVTVLLNRHEIPTAQISVLVFEDHNSINNVPDATEPGLPGFRVIILDPLGGGPILFDAFGNPLGTEYDAGGNVTKMGDSNLYTDANGRLLIKNLTPGKFGVQVIPPTGTDWNGGHGSIKVGGQWLQTSTIEGTLTIDAWVKANEPSVWVEGFGVGFYHVFFGFVDQSKLPWNINPPSPNPAKVTVTGQLRYNHFGRPPENQMFAVGEPVSQGWVGLNELPPIPAGGIGPIGGVGPGLYAAPCNPDGTFSIPNVPAGTYQLVTWDKPLDAIFGFNSITVGTPAQEGGSVKNLGPVFCYRWFGALEGSVFYDDNDNGFRDGILTGNPTEEGIPNQAVNLRFRDGRIYMATVTDASGDYEFAEVFPFFKWLVAEVDFARFKATGMTAVSDEGGVIPSNAYPHEGKRNAQPQYAVDPVTGVADPTQPIDAYGFSSATPSLWRTELGEVLTQAFHLFLNQFNRIDWGKKNYEPGENGGISGVVGYQITRAEEDPRDAVIDPWEPAVPRVQMVLYRDANGDKIIDDVNAPVGIQLADVDNYPFGNFPGPEDIDHNGNELWDMGDAIDVTWTDSWDDAVDETGGTLGAIQVNPPVVEGKPIVGSDFYSTWNQVRPGVFDGGYAFGDLEPGAYIVQTIPPPGYLIQTEESLNVAFGDVYKPSTLWLPPEVVGTRENHGGFISDAFVSSFVPGLRTDPYTVANALTLFPDAGEPVPFEGQVRPLADMKWVVLADGQNAAADFHVYTEVPKAARVVGFVLNDLTAEFNAYSPVFGEKGSPGWLPISFRDWKGNEVARTYCDEYGTYNAMIPSSYTVNAASPSGIVPNMLTVILNDPTMPDPADPTGKSRIPDPDYNPNYSVSPSTWMFWAGSVSYLDTPIVPVSSFVGYPNNQLDVEPPNETPVIKSVQGAGQVGPYITAANQVITITAAGVVPVPDPTSLGYGSPNTTDRNYGFGTTPGAVLINGVAAQIVSWNDSTITFRVGSALAANQTGQVLVRRGDNGVVSPIGVTLTFAGGGVLQVVPKDTAPALIPPGAYTSIQEAVDVASPGDLVLVAPGTYYENVVLWKPLRLQGAGAGTYAGGAGTVINANPVPAERAQLWIDKIEDVLGGNPFEANGTPGIVVIGSSMLPNSGNFATTPSRIDGLLITGSTTGGGIESYHLTTNLRISNNRIIGNQGIFGGGITLGMADAFGTFYDNAGVTIQYNQILKNGSINAAGGIAVFNGAEQYRILDNIIAGNFSRRNGGGIGHEGVSRGGLIANNTIVNNEVFYGLAVGGDGGGIYIGGQLAAGGRSSGSGSVTIINNLIQGNLAGAGHGGGIRLAGINGEDVFASRQQNNWYQVDILNNTIVNNVAGYAGGGISLQDATRVRIRHNTIANNQSTATAQGAFAAGAVNSTPQGAGIVSHLHTLALTQVLPGGAGIATFSDPELLHNIIWHNQALYWDGTSQTLVPAAAPYGPYKDLRVALPVATEPNNLRLTATRCLVSPGSVFKGAGNITTDINPFVAQYVNTLRAAVVIDEAGNNIGIRFNEIGLYNTAGQFGLGNYHLSGVNPTSAGSPINKINANQVPAGLGYDIDRESRPSPLEANPRRADIGADEFNSVLLANITLPIVPLNGPATDGPDPVVTPTPPVGPGIPAFTFEPMPADTDGVDTDGDGIPNNDHYYKRVSAGDGFSKMADGNELYQFGFADLTGVDSELVMAAGMLKAEIPAPTIALKEGQKFYLDLSNVGMLMRPDLFDPHTVHFHGFPQAASIFDGEPFASVAINVGATLRYFYNIVEAGTYIYHCHMEATEHMEMGMLGTIYVKPKQNHLPVGTPLAKLPPGKGTTHQAGYQYAYNDGDGSTYYDVEKELQFSAFDRNFHEQHILVQPLPFADLDVSYPMINGRGYPDTAIAADVTNESVQEVLGLDNPYPSQKIHSRIVATAGQRVLLRLSNVSLSDFHTITVLGIPMKVIAKDAKLLRGPTGLDLTYETTSFTFGGGETADVILDTTGVTPGTYFLYDSRLNHLANDQEDFGGMMTEIIIQ
jgi:large repetitive protein